MNGCPRCGGRALLDDGEGLLCMLCGWAKHVPTERELGYAAELADVKAGALAEPYPGRGRPAGRTPQLRALHLLKERVK